MPPVDISDLPAPPDISDLPAPPAPHVSLLDAAKMAGKDVVGAGETLLSGITGGIGSLADAVTGSDPGTHDWAYRPRTDSGQQTSTDLGHVVGAVNSAVASGGGSVVGAIGGDRQAATDTLNERLPEAEGAVGTVAAAGGLLKGAPKPAPTITETAQEAANKAASSGNAGAAGTAVDVSKLSPATQAELSTVKNANPVALKNIHDAETLPVPMTGERGLTAGQALQDSARISDEFNRKGENDNAYGKRYDAQDEGLQENLSTIHREASPTTVGNDDIQNGQSIIDSLKRYDAPKVQAINAAYKAAKDANGGDLQMDGTSFADSAETALKPQGRSRFLPPSAQGIIDDVKESGGKMSLDDFEGYRTALANEARKAQQSGDGNAVAAINKVRDALEATPPADGTSAAAKGLYDQARGLAKARFGEIDSDPAYAAAVSDSTPIGRLSPEADKFASSYILNGAKADLQQLRPKLDQEGGEAMTSAAMNYLQRQAGLDKGKFIQNGYNTALTKIGPKASELIGDSDTLDDLQKLGRVSKNMQVSSRGGYSNTSHTFVAGAKALATHAGEDLFNGVVPGARLGTKGAEFLARRAGNAAIHESLKPGAGLEN